MINCWQLQFKSKPRIIFFFQMCPKTPLNLKSISITPGNFKGGYESRLLVHSITPHAAGQVWAVLSISISSGESWPRRLFLGLITNYNTRTGWPSGMAWAYTYKDLLSRGGCRASRLVLHLTQWHVTHCLLNVRPTAKSFTCWRTTMHIYIVVRQ